jgi:hypothetical protein
LIPNPVQEDEDPVRTVLTVVTQPPDTIAARDLAVDVARR